MDLTVEVMLPPRGGNWNGQTNGAYRLLAPIAIYRSKNAPVVGMQQTGYIHVTDVTIPQSWNDLTADELRVRANAKLCAVREDVVERRLWCGDPTLLSAGARNALMTNRQLTVTWTQFKNVLRNLTAQRALTDGDLE